MDLPVESQSKGYHIRISSQLTPGIIFPFFSFQKHKQKVYSLNKLTHTNASILNEAALEWY